MVELISKHRRKGILVDTNVLLLYIIGSVDFQLIGKHKRTRAFTVEEYRVLNRLLSQFERIVTTPGILTETNNLAGQIGNPARDAIFEAFGRAVADMKERHVPAVRLVNERTFLPLGLTDSGISIAARKGFLVLTDDFPLYGNLVAQGRDVINFNHLREL